MMRVGGPDLGGPVYPPGSQASRAGEPPKSSSQRIEGHTAQSVPLPPPAHPGAACRARSADSCPLHSN